MKRFLLWLSEFIYPSKCAICGKLLSKEQSDLCHSCRADTAEYPKPNIPLHHIADWRALWYYEGKVRESLLYYKFHSNGARSRSYARLLAMRLHKEGLQFDLITWVPISRRRKHGRGFDQVELIAKAVARELGIPVVRTLRKHRHTPPQSSQKDAAQRRANVLGAYNAENRKVFVGKRILLLDDIITTGATVSECARTLLTAGAKEVLCAAIAAASHKKSKQ